MRPKPSAAVACPVCGGVAFFKCEKCGEEFYDRTQSLASSNERFAPQVRALREALEPFVRLLEPHEAGLQEARRAREQSGVFLDAETTERLEGDNAPYMLDGQARCIVLSNGDLRRAARVLAETAPQTPVSP